MRNSNLILGITVCAILQTSASKSPSFSRVKCTFLLLLFPKIRRSPSRSHVSLLQNENCRFVSRSSFICYLDTPKHVESLYRLLHIVLFILLYRFWSLDTCSSLSFTVAFVRLFRDYDFSNIRSAFFLLIDGPRFAVTVEHGLSIVYGYIQAKECAVHKAEEDILGVYFQMQFPQVTPISLVINFLSNKLIFLSF